MLLGELWAPSLNVRCCLIPCGAGVRAQHGHSTALCHQHPAGTPLRSPLPTMEGMPHLPSAWGVSALRGPAAPLCPAPSSCCAPSFYKYCFYFNIFCDLIGVGGGTFRLSNGSKLLKYICPWNKTPLCVVCFLQWLCTGAQRGLCTGAQHLKGGAELLFSHLWGH